MAFHIAGSMAFKDAMQKASPVLLEPIMRVEVTTPEDYMGDVIGDINSRRGRIEGMEDIGGGKMIRGYVPLAEMFGYATDLRSRTRVVVTTPCSLTDMSRFRSPYRKKFSLQRENNKTMTCKYP